jgi:hypothetical protein
MTDRSPSRRPFLWLVGPWRDSNCSSVGAILPSMQIQNSPRIEACRKGNEHLPIWVYFIWGVTALCSLYLSFRLPHAGYSLLAFGLVAAVTVFHEHQKPFHKVTWIFILVSFALIESYAIRNDRRSDEARLNDARRSENLHFETVVGKLQNMIGTLNAQVSTLSGLLLSQQRVEQWTRETKGKTDEIEELFVKGRPNPSLDSVLVAASKLTTALSEYQTFWKARVHNIELQRDDRYYNRTWDDQDARKKEYDSFKGSIDSANESERDDLRGILLLISNVQFFLVNSLPQSERTNDDEDEGHNIAVLIAAVPAMETYYDCCGKLPELADYMESLAKRAKEHRQSIIQ